MDWARAIEINQSALSRIVAALIGLVTSPSIVPVFRNAATAKAGMLLEVVACCLIFEVTLSMIGYGVQPPDASLGNLLVNASSNLTIAPWVSGWTCSVIVSLLFALFAVGAELRLRHARVVATSPVLGGSAPGSPAPREHRATRPRCFSTPGRTTWCSTSPMSATSAAVCLSWPIRSAVQRPGHAPLPAGPPLADRSRPDRRARQAGGPDPRRGSGRTPAGSAA